MDDVKRRRVTGRSSFIFTRQHLENVLRTTRSTLEFKIVPRVTIIVSSLLEMTRITAA
jgi:hypothetical protein